MRSIVKWAAIAAVVTVSTVYALPGDASAQNRDGCRECECPYQGGMNRGYGGDARCGDDDWRGRGQGYGMGQGMGQGMHQGNGYGMRQGMRQGMRDDRGMRQGGGRSLERFQIIDANEDGRISDDEAAAMRESVFYAMDGDDDGELTLEEYMTVRMGPGPRDTGQGRMHDQRQEAKKARFEPMDTDGNGTVSKAEWMTAGLERFRSADSDGDGTVTPWEFRSLHRFR